MFLLATSKVWQVNSDQKTAYAGLTLLSDTGFIYESSSLPDHRLNSVKYAAQKFSERLQLRPLYPEVYNFGFSHSP